jgi:putative Flp pilus-assembly TadE/G-like protein
MNQPRGRAGGAQAGGTENGSITLMLAVLFVAMIAMAGIVIDGGAKLTAAENATAIAQEAARAGAGMVNPQAAYTGGNFVVSRTAAVQAANEYLARTGYQAGSTVVATGNTIRVVVHVTRPTRILSIIHIDSFSVTGTGTATLAAGVTGPGR